MRNGRVVLLIFGLLVVAAPISAGTVPPGGVLLLKSIAHTIDGSALIISGWVENRGPSPAGGLVVDAAGFSPSGDLASFGSDGIPWEIAPGGAERFTIRLPILDKLIRDYAVQVASARSPVRLLAGLQRGVELSLYRPLILSMVKVKGDFVAGTLVVSNQTKGLPVEQITVEATLLLPDPNAVRLQTLVLTVPADGTRSITIGIPGTLLVTLRVTDLLLKTSWPE